MNALTLVRKRAAAAAPMPATRRDTFFWTAGNLLMLLGLYLLLYVGGLFADEQYNLWAAQGDSEIALPPVVAAPRAEPAIVAPRVERATQSGAVTAAEATSQPIVQAQPAAVPTAAPKRFTLPRLNNPGGGRELNSVVPIAVEGYGPSTVSRIVIPRFNIDRKVGEVGWNVEEVNGQQVAVWEVAKYTVGHHRGTANPGQRGNIVMAGHSGGRAYPFNDLFYLQQGDTIVLWSNGQQYDYTVTERLVLDEIGPNVTMEQRRANARYIEPTEEEVTTLVTCWPLTGPNKFNQRVVIRAVPNRPTAPEIAPSIGAPSGGWTAR